MKGIAEFPKDKVFPKTTDSNAKNTHLFIADTATGPALQFAEATAFPSGYDSTSSPNNPHAEIVTDRNLYRPGQTVKMKGLARDVTAAKGLTNPVRAAVHWSISESYGNRVLGEGDTTLSAYGGWEAEWNVPEKQSLGVTTCVAVWVVAITEGLLQSTFKNSGFRCFRSWSRQQRQRLVLRRMRGSPLPIFTVHRTQVRECTGKRAGPHRRISPVIPTNRIEKRFNSYAEVGPRFDVDSEDIKTIEGDTQLDAHGFATIACESPFKDNPAVSRMNISWRADVTSIDGQTLTGGDTATLFATETRLGIRAEEQTTEPAGVKVQIDALNSEDEKEDGILVRADLFHVTTKTVKEQLAPLVYRYRNRPQAT
jgi:MG2 domain-containing protein